jgi:hypothetical protein
MSEPNYAARNALALTKLDDAKAHLDKAIELGLDHPASAHVAEALRHVVEAQSELRGG